MNTIVLAKKLFILSILLNIFLGTFFGVYVAKKGGISYIFNRITFKEAQDNFNRKAISKKYYVDKRSLYDLLKIDKDDIVFIGDSLVSSCEWNELLCNNRIKNRGIGGDTTKKLLKRIDAIVSSFPKKIFIMVGTIDIGNRRKVPEMIADYKKIIEKISNTSPKTQIYVQSVLPINGSINIFQKHKTDGIIEFNKALKMLSLECNATYIDLHACFATANHMLSDKYTHDGLHLNGLGYLVWKSEIEKYLIE